MKRKHQKIHRLTWFILTPILLAFFYIAVGARVDTPVQNTWPGATEKEHLP